MANQAKRPVVLGIEDERNIEHLLDALSGGVDVPKDVKRLFSPDGAAARSAPPAATRRIRRLHNLNLKRTG